MSKELELFRQIVKGYTETFNMAIHHPKDTIVKWEGVEEIEQSLNALEIIKEKRVNVSDFIRTRNVEQYNDYLAYNDNEKLTQEDYDILKEELK